MANLLSRDICSIAGRVGRRKQEATGKTIAGKTIQHAIILPGMVLPVSAADSQLL